MKTIKNLAVMLLLAIVLMVPMAKATTVWGAVSTTAVFSNYGEPFLAETVPGDYSGQCTVDTMTQAIASIDPWAYFLIVMANMWGTASVSVSCSYNY